jgi:5-methylcytosine-specific restriction endonuclease McrA
MRDPEKHRAWLEANKERVAEYQRRYRERNKEKRASTVKRWRDANPDKVKASNARGGKKWAAANKATRLASVRTRQLAKKQRTPAWADLKAIREVYKTAARLTKETGIPHEVDHVVPLQGETVSGLHVHTNLQVLTRSENRKKGNALSVF